jgi:hypothetical protein
MFNFRLDTTPTSSLDNLPDQSTTTSPSHALKNESGTTPQLVDALFQERYNRVPSSPPMPPIGSEIKRSFPSSYFVRRSIRQLLMSSGFGQYLPSILPCDSLSEIHPNFDFRELQRLTDHMTKLRPLSEHCFIGMGRSPFPSIAHLNLTQPECAWLVPLSYNRYISIWDRLYPYAPKKEDVPPYSWGMRKYFMKDADPKWERRQHPNLRSEIFDHFDRFFPSEESIGGRRIVLVDFCDYGTSLTKFYVDATAYLAERGRTHEISCMFVDQRAHETCKYWGNGKWFRNKFKDVEVSCPDFDCIDFRAGFPYLQFLFDFELLKPFAPYPHMYFDPNLPSPSADLKLNPLYVWFEQGLLRDFIRFHFKGM